MGTGLGGGGLILGHVIWSSGVGVFIVTFWRVLLGYFFPLFFVCSVWEEFSRGCHFLDYISWCCYGNPRGS